MTIRHIEKGEASVSVRSLQTVASGLSCKLNVLLVPPACHSDIATFAVATNVIQDGFQSWKIHFMELVDEFRKTLDPRLLLLPPPQSLVYPLKALLASIVVTLSSEAGMDTPEWATKRYVLDTPWFVSEMESLKPSSLVESPLPFRRNNIYVLDNFLKRA